MIISYFAMVYFIHVGIKYDINWENNAIYSGNPGMIYKFRKSNNNIF